MVPLHAGGHTAIEPVFDSHFVQLLKGPVGIPAEFSGTFNRTVANPHMECMYMQRVHGLPSFLVQVLEFPE